MKKNHQQRLSSRIQVHLDAGSTDRLAQQSLQIPQHANNRILPNWLFDARLFVRDRLTSSHPDAILVTPYPLNPKQLPLLTCNRCSTLLVGPVGKG